MNEKPIFRTRNPALNCKQGGFVISRHSNIRDLDTNLKKQVHSDLEFEPHLQPINGENINGSTGDDTRPDIRARSVWQNGQSALFELCATNVNANSQNHLHQPKF